MARFWIEGLPASNAVAVFDLKTLLKAHGWTVQSSSDGTTYNSGGDQITTGAAGANGMDNNSAWFCIRSPNGLVEFTIQRGGAGSTNNYRIKVGRTTFNAGSPGATQTPQTTNPTLDERILLGGGTDAAPTFGVLVTATPGTARTKAMVDDVSGEFYFAAFPDGGGNPTGGLMLTGIEEGEPGDPWPYIAYSNATSPWAVTSMNSITTGGCKSWPSKAGLPSALVLPQTFNSGANIVMPGGAAADPITGDHPIAKVFIARAAGDAGNVICCKGIATLFRWKGVTGDATGDTYSLDSTKDWIIFRDCVLPWNGTVPTNGVASTDRVASDLAPLDEDYALVNVGGGASVNYKMYGLKDPGPGEKTWVSTGRADFAGAKAGEALQAGSIGVDSIRRK